MNPFRYGWFAFMLISHKLLRWLPYLLTPLAILSLALLATHHLVARLLVGVLILGLLSGAISIRRRKPTTSLPFALAGFVVAVLSAGFLAWWGALTRAHLATWQPTPRPDRQL
jgi:cytochrome bd-type quinol oxidase subunit 1